MKLLHNLKFVLIPILTIFTVRSISQPDSQNQVFLPSVHNSLSPTKLFISDILDNRLDYAGGEVPRYEKFEITFQVHNTLARNLQFPYDPDPPTGLDSSNPNHNGISVDALFLPPGETDWKYAFRQPAFFYQYFDDQIKPDREGRNREWYYPIGDFAWKVRFSPDKAGAWQYLLTAQDSGGRTQTTPRSFDVAESNHEGFVKVSSADPRYFEYDSGNPFYPLGFQGAGSWDDSYLTNKPLYQTYGQNGINLVRVWVSGLYGTAWLEWLGGRNIYDGYLPRSGTEAYHDPVSNLDTLTLRIDYETEGDLGWYDACRFQFWDDPEAVKPNTNYRLQIKYWGKKISGPRITGSPNFGLVGKIGGNWQVDCYEPGTSTVITDYGTNTSDWGYITGTWNAGDNNFLPKIYVGLENVVEGIAFVNSISLREDLGNGQFGPEIIKEPSMEYQLYFPEKSAYALDKIINLAEENGVYLKLVIMEKNDMIYLKLDDDGTFVFDGEEDNLDGFYGLGRGINKTRWLQQAWWRYLQARWGYSRSIHSWELTNEGDPSLKEHYELADELGKFMHCQVFGVDVSPGDGHPCTFNHPNSHMVTTSFWHSFPSDNFWANSDYPNVDYADLHAYISTSSIGIPSSELEKMQWDAAYYHIGHSLLLGEWEVGKPIVRGEAGIDSVDQQTEQPGLALDHNGVWLHNYLWSTTDPGALMELYWYRENLESQPGPDGQRGLYEIYRYFADFIGGIPLNSGDYADVHATVTDQNLRAVGQKDLVHQQAYLWIQNKNHTWKNVIDGVSNLSGLSGKVMLDGFSPNTTLNVEWHEFESQGVPSIQHSVVTSDEKGIIELTLPTNRQLTDVGIKIGY